LPLWKKPGDSPGLFQHRAHRDGGSGDEYRERASECIAAADQVAEPERKVGLLELAQRWLRLAFQVEKIEDRKGVRGDVLLDNPQAPTSAPRGPRRPNWRFISVA
jgi:hypothetical protein